MWNGGIMVRMHDVTVIKHAYQYVIRTKLDFETRDLEFETRDLDFNLEISTFKLEISSFKVVISSLRISTEWP